MKIRRKISEKNNYTDKRKRYKRKKFILLKYLLYLVIGAVILILLALSPIFNVNRIEVYGNNHYNNNDIINSVNIIKGTNWFRTSPLDFNQIISLRNYEQEDKIREKLYYVKDVEVKFRVPGTVKIKITERKPVGILSHLGTGIVIDREGYMIDTATKDDTSKKKLPVINGLDVEYYSLGQKIRGSNLDNLESFNRIVDIINKVEYDDKDKYVLLDHINHIDISDADSVHIMLDSRINVNLGPSESINDYTIRKLKQIYFTVMDKKDKGYLDFTTGSNPSFIPK